ncbi:MAG TPA: Gldg family protein [Anaerolineales bacterium]|nr:Gldg family protein [Anaerolineales bacterium]
MKPEWRRFAPWGLWLALAAALVAIGLYIVRREWDLAQQIVTGLVVVGLALFAVLDPNKIRSAVTGRQARYGSNALILTLAFLGILVVANVFFYNNTKEWDLTEDKQNTLAAETLDVLTSLPETVTARAFFTPEADSETAQQLLDRYAAASDDKFRYEFIDPLENPVAAQDAQVTRDGTVALYLGEHKELVETLSEQELTGALVRLMNPTGRVIYFLTGHGEFSPDDTGDQSFAGLKEKLVSKNYTVQSLNLLATNQIPADANVIVIGGPLKPLTDAEVGMLEAFVNGGGSLVVMLEPTLLTEAGAGAADPLAAYLTAAWGLGLADDVVVDLSSQQAYVAYAAEYGDHAITQKMNRMVTVFPTARSVTAAAQVSGVTQVQLITTSDQSWAESDTASALEGTINPDQGVDVMGPISMAVAAENFGTGSKVVVFGDAEFASDYYLSAYGNQDMIVNSLDWAAGQEDLISLTAKETTQRVLVTPQNYVVGLLFLVSVILLPGLVIVGGVIAWLSRRKRG